MNASRWELPWEGLRRVTDPSQLPFESTADIEPLIEVLGQDRALRAIEFGLDISSSGFNLFLAGQPGTGKTIILKRILSEFSKKRPVPFDTLYVHNFEAPEAPAVLRLPAGVGARFHDDVHELIQELQQVVPQALEGKEYQEQQRHVTEGTEEQKKALIGKLNREVEAAGFKLKATPMGFQAVAVHNEKPLTQEAYDAMAAPEREELDENIEVIEGKIREVMLKIKDLDRTLKGQLRDLNRQVGRDVLGTLLTDLRNRYQEHKEVLEYLDRFDEDIIENIQQFLRREEEEPSGLSMRFLEPKDDLTRYKVNLVVDNSALEGAPIVFETNPSYQNLVGRIERRSQFGALTTDFTLIRAGSLAKANGGCLVLEIEDLLQHPYSFEALKRAIKNEEVRIEELSERVGLVSLQTLRPEPITLDIKVCLIGRPLYYHLLFAYDEDFRESFKVKADFDYQTDRTDEIAVKFGSFVSRLVKDEQLPHFDRTAVAAIVDECSRWVDDQRKLSVRFGQVDDLVREAAYWAGKAAADVVSAVHVERAVEEMEYRSSLAKERVQELIKRDVLMVETEKRQIGQVNGLAVHMLGDYVFGRPTKITASVQLGTEGVINIERRVNLSHSTHDKGVLILSAFLGERFAQEQPLSLSASLTFEQSYSEIAGDSASSTELYALLSALSGLPLRQGVAVTGSVNQKGDVQAIGAVNDKIEGFFDICAARGLNGEHGVIVPKANAQNLMLRQRTVEAVRQKKFHIWAVDHVDQGIAILTGVEAGSKDASGQWTSDSVNDRVDKRLGKLSEALRNWGSDRGPGTPEVLAPRDYPSSTEPPPPKPPGRPEK